MSCVVQYEHSCKQELWTYFMYKEFVFITAYCRCLSSPVPLCVVSSMTFWLEVNTGASCVPNPTQPRLNHSFSLLFMVDSLPYDYDYICMAFELLNSFQTAHLLRGNQQSRSILVSRPLLCFPPLASILGPRKTSRNQRYSTSTESTPKPDLRHKHKISRRRV